MGGGCSPPRVELASEVGGGGPTERERPRRLGSEAGPEEAGGGGPTGRAPQARDSAPGSRINLCSRGVTFPWQPAHMRYLLFKASVVRLGLSTLREKTLSQGATAAPGEPGAGSGGQRDAGGQSGQVSRPCSP